MLNDVKSTLVKSLLMRISSMEGRETKKKLSLKALLHKDQIVDGIYQPG